MRGRVMSLYGLIFRGGPALGALGAGIISLQLGLRWPIAHRRALLLVAWLWTCCPPAHRLDLRGTAEHR
jgi:MFS family permease